ncbi:amino acid ABC transporter permease [Klebsiella sp. BIGb0407]|uniref:amino acid ABC transporter permease n=1 Tax=Klebsiella sp. BIGb0407 TaxID=2940603 RepID=UPI002167BB1A|nr:amino acid ABC transporter permease [Klebsiella sp. BIGb0407]MCS3429865.1 polar amino acid transport system permease protein [Klebsiella sp. BIGb0407]
MQYVFHLSDILPYKEQLIIALLVTIKLALAAIAGTLIASILLLWWLKSGGKLIKSIIRVYIEVIRNTPILVQLFLVFYGAPLIGIRLDSFVAALVGLIINASAYTTEILRGGLKVTGSGQDDAANTLGLSPFFSYLVILLPQSMRAVFPALTNQMVVLMLNTSVCSFIALDELTAQSMTIASDTYRMFEVYFMMAVIYLLITFTLVGLFRIAQYLFLNWGAKS